MGRRPISIEERKRRRNFGALLRQRRLFLGFGLRETARIAGLDHPRLSRIESGERPSAVADLPGLERAYEVPLEALQIARSGQIPSSLIRDLFVPPKTGDHRTERFSVRATPAEKRELSLFLGYLRFIRRAEH